MDDALGPACPWPSTTMNDCEGRYEPVYERKLLCETSSHGAKPLARHPRQQPSLRTLAGRATTPTTPKSDRAASRGRRTPKLLRQMRRNNSLGHERDVFMVRVPLTVRSGEALDSSKVGVLEKGAVVRILRQGTLPDSTERALVARMDEPHLQHPDATADADKSSEWMSGETPEPPAVGWVSRNCSVENIDTLTSFHWMRYQRPPPHRLAITSESLPARLPSCSPLANPSSSSVDVSGPKRAARVLSDAHRSEHSNHGRRRPPPPMLFSLSLNVDPRNRWAGVAHHHPTFDVINALRKLDQELPASKGDPRVSTITMPSAPSPAATTASTGSASTSSTSPCSGDGSGTPAPPAALGAEGAAAVGSALDDFWASVGAASVVGSAPAGASSPSDGPSAAKLKGPGAKGGADGRHEAQVATQGGVSKGGGGSKSGSKARIIASATAPSRASASPLHISADTGEQPGARTAGLRPSLSADLMPPPLPPTATSAEIELTADR